MFIYVTDHDLVCVEELDIVEDSTPVRFALYSGKTRTVEYKPTLDS